MACVCPAIGSDGNAVVSAQREDVVDSRVDAVDLGLEDVVRQAVGGGRHVAGRGPAQGQGHLLEGLAASDVEGEAIAVEEAADGCVNYAGLGRGERVA